MVTVFCKEIHNKFMIVTALNVSHEIIDDNKTIPCSQRLNVVQILGELYSWDSCLQFVVQRLHHGINIHNVSNCGLNYFMPAFQELRNCK